MGTTATTRSHGQRRSLWHEPHRSGAQVNLERERSQYSCHLAEHRRERLGTGRQGDAHAIPPMRQRRGLRTELLHVELFGPRRAATIMTEADQPQNHTVDCTDFAISLASNTPPSPSQPWTPRVGEAKMGRLGPASGGRELEANHHGGTRPKTDMHGGSWNPTSSAVSCVQNSNPSRECQMGV